MTKKLPTREEVIEFLFKLTPEPKAKWWPIRGKVTVSKL